MVWTPYPFSPTSFAWDVFPPSILILINLRVIAAKNNSYIKDMAPCLKLNYILQTTEIRAFHERFMNYFQNIGATIG